MHNFTRPDGCRDQLLTCQSRLKAPSSSSDFVATAKLCDMEPWCESPAIKQYFARNHGWYDIGHPNADPFPAPHMQGYLTQGSVLSALGSPVNFSSSSHAVSSNFGDSFDGIKGGFMDAVAYLLDSGVKVHMMYGDRDYACNWIGGEMVSLQIPYSRIDDFASSGYTPLVTTEGVKGLTRQFGNFSFTRVFQAGHEVPSYQPLAAYDIFMRATFNRDIATGILPVTDELATIGPLSSWHIKNNPPERPEPRCYVLKPDSCLPDVWATVKNGTAIIKDFFVVGVEEEKTEQEVVVAEPEDDSQEYIGEL
jgi:hypothetical protein